MLVRRSLILLLVCACSGKTPREGIEVVVELEAPLASTCARVIATGGSQPVETKPMALAGKTELHVGVARGALPQDIKLQAVGYSDAQCTTRTVPAEHSASVAATFLAKFPVVRLTLAGPTTNGDAGTDLDGDGFPLPADCNDADAGVNPSAPELCANGFDEDCDGLVDCADAPSCNGMSCGMQGMCMNGGCLAPTEQGLCADGFDNDGDGVRDCLDSDCPAGATCSDFDRCTTGDVCSGDGGCAPAAVTMCTAPNACFMPVGQCLPDAGTCVFTPSGASTCEDGVRCTVSDSCLADGGCTGTPTVCPTGNAACRAMNGICREALDGGCDYPPLAAGPCDDLDDCTVGDGCDGDGGCVGTRVTCTAVPGECFQFSGNCNDDGGCVYTPRTGACDGGVCGADGGCSTVNPFPFVPSNFSPSQLPAPAGAYTFGCGTTVLDTVSNDGGVQWMNSCPAQPVPPHRIIMVGGQQTVLLSFDAITINGGSSLRLIGGRPVIIAAQGAVTLSGNIDVSSVLAAQRGAGSNNNCMTGRGADGQTGGNPETGGGGGGGAFGSDGGNGSTSLGGILGGAGGTPRGMRELVPLQGGCQGGNGGRATSMWGFGGAGGGAVQLTSAGQVLLNGGAYVTASGSGGRGGQADQRIGGGGGGSGGGILIEAQRIQLNGSSFLTANGGAGGEGSGYGGAMWSGVDGQEGSYITAVPAQSVSIGACGGNGGTGAAGTTAAGNGGPPTVSGCQSNVPGGGGGGGVGRIRLNAGTGGCSINGTAVISPPATSNGAAGCP